VDRATRKRVTLKVFEAEVTRRYRPPAPVPSYSRLTLEEKERVRP
jgi:hypothetical protein